MGFSNKMCPVLLQGHVVAEAIHGLPRRLWRLAMTRYKTTRSRDDVLDEA